MSFKPSRFVGLAFTVVVVVLMVMIWRLRPRTDDAAAPPPARRGGQLVATIRTEPRSFNRLVAADLASDTVSLLTQARLVRVNRVSFELEPWLAERWESSDDGLTHTLYLREGLTWSDGTPLTADDVLFTLGAAYDPRSKSPLAGVLTVGGQPIAASSPDARTVVLRFPGPSGPGLRLLDSLPILPKHKLQAAFDAGAFSSAWAPATPPADIVGAGPFVLREHQPGQRLVLERNPRFWRRAPDGGALPYLDRVVLEVVPEQNAELLRLQSGASDLTYSELRPEDYVPVRRAEDEGKLRLIELGVAPDADALWFCMKPEVKKADPRFAFVQKREFRQALSHAVDREAFAQEVFLGEAVPVWGPITPGNPRWFSPNVPRYPYDVAKARALLASIGLEDRNGNGVVEDAAGTEARFTLMTQRGLGASERGTAFIRGQAQMAGIAFDVVPLEGATMIERMLACRFDAVYMRPLATDLDPAGNLDYWLSSGASHLWNMSQRTPATEWEKRIDTLMIEQAATTNHDQRRELFDTVQRIYAENVPALYFAAPRLYAAHSTRVSGVTPSVMRPSILWSADTLSVTD